MGFWQFATGGGSGGGTGDVVGPASSTDNAIARYDGATGKLQQNSAVTVSDVAAGVVTLATTAGNALAIANTNPVATTGASVAGDPLTITAGSAVASTDTAGAASGGDLVLSPGDAARNTSGNAYGGWVQVDYGSGIGTGTGGGIAFGPVGGDFQDGLISSSGVAVTQRRTDGSHTFSGGALSARTAYFGGANPGSNAVGTTGTYGFRTGTGGAFGFSASANGSDASDTEMKRAEAAGQVAVSNATNGMANNIKIATTTVNASGATSTATNLVPAGCILLGVTTRVTKAITSGDGGTSVNIGNGTDADMYGATIAFALGTTTTLASHTASPLAFVSAAQNVVFTCNGGTFSGGVWRVCAHFLDLTGPTS